MPPRKAKIPERVELANLPGMDGAPPDETYRTPTEERREVEFEEILNELGSDSRVKVWQIIDGKSSYAGEMSGAEFSLDTLLETYGGGDKSLVIYQGKTKKDTVRVSLDPSIAPRNPRTARLVAGQPAAGPAGDMSGMFATMMAAQMQSMSATQQMMTGMVTAVTTLMAARPDKDPTDMALKIAEILRPKDNDGGGGSMDLMMSMLDRGLNIGKAIGAGGESDSVMPIIGEGVKTLGHLIDGIVTEKKANADAIRRGIIPATTSAPATGPTAPALETITQPVEEIVNVRPWVDAARPHMGLLLSAARFMSPEAAADTVSRALTDDQFFDLVEDIQDQTAPGFGPRLLAYFPDASSVNPDWIGALVAAVLTSAVEDEDDGTAPPNTNTNTNGEHGA
jgi:hypothetical protein